MRLAFPLRDTYFLNFTMNNYESRVLERPVMPGVALIGVRPWEGRVMETGVELTLDMNNVLEARLHQAEPHVTQVALDSIAQTLQYVMTSAGPHFVETGELSLDDVIRASEPIAT